MSTIIAFTGPKGCGKSTAATYLIEKHGFVRHYFAKPLKEMAKCLGLTEEHVNGGLKEKPCDFLGNQTPRWILQSLGTEWGRKLIHPDLWTIAWENTLPDCDIVCDDLRFPNELKTIKEKNGIVIEITRPEFERDQSHESEAHEIPFDFQISNDGSIEEMFEKIEHFIKEKEWYMNKKEDNIENQEKKEIEASSIVKNIEGLLEMAKKGEITSFACGFQHRTYGSGKYWGFIDGNVHQLCGILDEVKLEMIQAMREASSQISIEQATKVVNGETL